MYCTLDDLKARVPEAVLIGLTDDEGAGTVHAGRVQEAIDAAGALVDSYAQARYPVPFNPVPRIIKDLAVDIAAYKLFARRGYDEESADRSVVQAYKDAVRFLEMLARGLVQIGATAPAPAAPTDVQAKPRTFSRESMEGF